MKKSPGLVELTFVRALVTQKSIVDGFNYIPLLY